MSVQLSKFNIAILTVMLRSVLLKRQCLGRPNIGKQLFSCLGELFQQILFVPWNYLFKNVIEVVERRLILCYFLCCTRSYIINCLDRFVEHWKLFLETVHVSPKQQVLLPNMGAYTYVKNFGRQNEAYLVAVGKGGHSMGIYSNRIWMDIA